MLAAAFARTGCARFAATRPFFTGAFFTGATFALATGASAFAGAATFTGAVFLAGGGGARGDLGFRGGRSSAWRGRRRVGIVLRPTALSSQLRIRQHFSKGFLRLGHQLRMRNSTLLERAFLFLAVQRKSCGAVHLSVG